MPYANRLEENAAGQRPALPPVLIAGTQPGQLLTPDQAATHRDVTQQARQTRRDQRLAANAARNQANDPVLPPVLIGKALTGTAYTPDQADTLREGRRQRQQTRRREKSAAAEAMPPEAESAKSPVPEKATDTGREAEDPIVQGLMQGWRNRLDAAEHDPIATTQHKNRIAGARTSIFTAKQLNHVISDQAQLEQDVAAAVAPVQLMNDERALRQELAQRQTDLAASLREISPLVTKIADSAAFMTFFPAPAGRLGAASTMLVNLKADGLGRVATFKAHVAALDASSRPATPSSLRRRQRVPRQPTRV
jgi:hypothetical protein